MQQQLKPEMVATIAASATVMARSGRDGVGGFDREGRRGFVICLDAVTDR